MQQDLQCRLLTATGSLTADQANATEFALHSSSERF